VSRVPADARAFLRQCFEIGLGAVSGESAISSAIRRDGAAIRIGDFPPRFSVDPRRAHVLAAGKAALTMARAWHAHAGAPRAGLAIAREPGVLPAPWRALVGGHPLPSEASAQAGRAALAFAAAVPADAELVVLLSGGASALLSTPLPGLSIAEVRETTDLLLRCGAEIGELNCVRKHLTGVGGGRLAAATAARVVVGLVISDVIDDDLGTIGSGPCAPDATTFADAVAALRARAIWERAPAAVRAHLERGVAGEVPETPKPGARAFERVRHHIAANNLAARTAIARSVADDGTVAVLADGPPLRGEARVVGAEIVRDCLRERRAGALAGRRTLWIRGGETTVTVRGEGRGGRCQELALAAAIALEGEGGVTLLAAGTDGSDGPTAAAGAFADRESCVRGRAAGVDARDALARNDAHGFFEREGGLFETGATGTNALDLVLVLVEPRS
jgi:glycerate-2-kinase